MALARKGPSIGAAVWRFLRSNDLAIVLLIGLTILFAAGSIIRELHPSAYEGLTGDDLRFFLRQFRVIDLWFWSMVLFLTLLGVSLGVCAVDALVRKSRAARLMPDDFGPILLHVGIGLALLAHAIGGIRGSETIGVVTEAARLIGDQQVRLLAMDRTLHPNGAIRNQSVTLEMVDEEGTRTVRHAAYNDPARWAAGSEMLLLLQIEERPGRAVLVCDGRVDTLTIGGTLTLGDGGRLALEDLFGPPEYRVPVARVRILGGPRAGTHLVARGVAGTVEGIEVREAIPVVMAMMNYRRAPGTLWLIASAILAGAGVFLTGARWCRIVRRRSAVA